jgi:hypothetical protein
MVTTDRAFELALILDGVDHIEAFLASILIGELAFDFESIKYA